jgi:alpha-glucosidase (family GH31 glycosyl hydrolase)
MSKNTFIFIIILFLSLTKSSKYENDYIIESITYNEHRTSVSVNIKYNKSPSEFSLAEYDLEKPRLKASIRLIESLIFEFSIKCDKIFQFTIRDSKNERSEPEYFLNENMENEFNTIGKKLNLDDIGFTLANINEPFYFNLKDKSGNIYYHFDGANFLYTDTLIIFDQLLTTGYIYGFGERNYDFNLDIGRYTIWGNDTTYTNRDRKDGGWNLMGHQPIGLHLTKYKKYLGLLFLNANCQDVVIDNINSKKNNKYQNLDINSFSHILRHITIGGIINYYITLGDTPEESILGLHSIYGHPTLPPFWGLGWHQCRWGYKNTGQLREVRQNYLSNDIPLDALWTDIDMMDQKRNFILGRSFSDVPDFIKYLHNNGQHFIPLVDYGIPKKSYDPYYKMGLNSNAFLYSNFTKEFLISDVWPGQSVFPDFFINEGIELWKSGLNDYDKQLNFDGMWIDMNEPAMIGGHRGDLAEIVDSSQVTKDKNIYLDIPYLPGEGPLHTSLSHNTISVNAYSRKNDPKNNFYTMYNVKSLISKIQIKITNEYLNSVDKRPFIVSRANTIGHGKYAFHWLGDNISTFEMLRWSISGIFNYNIFGIPFSGADICGFHHSSTDELCARWHILGSFYPFSRNHNVDTGLPQEPWEFNSRSRFEDRNDNNRPIEGYTLHAAKAGIKMRYSLMRYAYSQFMLISLGKKGAYFKPAFFEFPEDDTLLNDMEIQNTHIMVGDSIYFIPCLNREQSDYRGYFPNANFNSIVDLKNILTYNKDNNSGSYIILNGGMTTINAFLLGGKIIPFQNTAKVLNSKDLRSTPISLIINPDQNNLANGYVIFDNDDKDVIKDNNYMSIYLKYEDYTLNFNLENNLKEKKYYYEDNKIESIILLRAKEFNIANSVTISTNLKNIDNEIIYEEMSDSLKIKFNEPYEIQNFKAITFKTTLQNNEAMNNVDQVIDNNQESKDKDKDKENNKEDNNKDINKENKDNNSINKEDKDNKQKEDKKEQIKIKKNSSKLILVKILIFIIFVLLSAIIILFVKIKSLQKKKTSYIELAGLDSV